MFRNIPTVTKNLLVINILAYLATIILRPQGIDLEYWGGLHYFLAPDFGVYQLLSYMFLHGSFTHLFFNMFALWMFGCVIERTWGSRRFLFYYILCGVGAGLCQEIVQAFSYGSLVGGATSPAAAMMAMASITIGASGAVYGILLAFGMTFPNERIFIFPLPVPIKAKWFVCIYAGIELFSAMSSRGDGVAHIAHLGGMLFGLLLILHWRRQERNGLLGGGARRKNGEHSGWGQQGGRGGWGLQDGGARRRNGEHSGWGQQDGRDGWGNGGRGGQPPRTATREDDMAYNAEKQARQEEIDRLLDKIRKSGYDSLTKAEKQRLFEASRER